MQNTITARQTPFNLIALVAFLIVVALLVGFVAGAVYSKPAPVAISATITQPSALRSGWVYRYDSATNKWYGYHYEATPAGLLIDVPYELNGPGILGDACGLNRAEPDC